jgi:hypothetical protein
MALAAGESWLGGGAMGALKRWLMARLVALLEGSWTSGAESCDYLRRLSAVPSHDAREERRAA